MNTQQNRVEKSLKIAWLYPELMSTYGDRGNIITLQKRCQWRDIDCLIVHIDEKAGKKDLERCDLIFMGGAQDRQQQLVNDDLLHNKGPVLKAMVEQDVPALFVCAAYQFAGTYYKDAGGKKLPGLKLFDLYTEHPGDQRKRLIGNVLAKLSTKLQAQSSKLQTIVGFENHGGRTYLGDKVQPLAIVQKGNGNNGQDGTEGAIYKNVIGSYFHGPLLPKNPHVADWLMQKALETKYATEISLPQLDDTIEWHAHVAAKNLD